MLLLPGVTLVMTLAMIAVGFSSPSLPHPVRLAHQVPARAGLSRVLITLAP